MANNWREIEIKLPVADVNDGRRRLRKAGFEVAKRRVLEKNTLYDTESLDLRRTSRMLRVREVGKNSILTFKGVPDVGKHKSREEIETELSSGPAFSAILERLGYGPTFRYEKFRTEFERRGSKGVATLDETPIGIYIELEGAPQWIDRMARMLGFEEKDYVTASYARLFFEWRERNAYAPAEMSFHNGGVSHKRAGD